MIYFKNWNSLKHNDNPFNNAVEYYKLWQHRGVRIRWQLSISIKLITSPFCKTIFKLSFTIYSEYNDTLMHQFTYIRGWHLLISKIVIMKALKTLRMKSRVKYLSKSFSESWRVQWPCVMDGTRSIEWKQWHKNLLAHTWNNTMTGRVMNRN